MGVFKYILINATFACVRVPSVRVGVLDSSPLVTYGKRRSFERVFRSLLSVSGCVPLETASTSPPRPPSSRRPPKTISRNHEIRQIADRLHNIIAARVSYVARKTHFAGPAGRTAPKKLGPQPLGFASEFRAIQNSARP